MHVAGGIPTLRLFIYTKFNKSKLKIRELYTSNLRIRQSFMTVALNPLCILLLRSQIWLLLLCWGRSCAGRSIGTVGGVWGGRRSSVLALATFAHAERLISNQSNWRKKQNKRVYQKAMRGPREPESCQQCSRKAQKIVPKGYKGS